MSLGQIVVDGAARAAQLVPLLFALNAPVPAAAQLPRAVSAADASFGIAAEEAPPLTQTEHHVDVSIVGTHALVRSTLVYRNERAIPVSASFAFPFPTLIERGGAWRPLAEDDNVATDAAFSEDDGADCGDESPTRAEFAEVGEFVPPRLEVGYVTVAPGERIKLETHRRIDLVALADGGWRLALPLPVEAGAPYSPQFSADVNVMAPLSQPTIARLASVTHGGVTSALGEANAQLLVPNGRAYTGRQFIVDVAFGNAKQARSLVATWGGEARPR